MFWNIIIGLVSFALQMVLAPKPQDAKPASLEDFDAPTAEEGREIPVLFGTREIKGPNVTWFGALGLSAIKGARRYGLFGPKQTIGWRYFLGMQMGLCHGPADKVIKIRVSDKVAFEGTAVGGPITINKGSLFGGDDREGGISGTLDLEMGEPTQDQNDYLVSKLGATVSAFRGVVTAVLRGMYLGTTPYIKPWAFTVQRIFLRSDGSEQWYPAKAAVPAFQIPDDEPGAELADGDTMNDEGQLDTNGDYAAWGEFAEIKVWHLPDGAEQTATIPGTDLAGGKVHITDYEELVVRSGGDLSGTSPTFLQFRRISDIDTVLQSIDLEGIISAAGQTELNFGFVMGERQGKAVVKLGPDTAEGQPWIILSRSESGWDVSDHNPGASHSGDRFVDTISMGPTYAYCRLETDTRIIRVTWNGTWSEDLIDLTAIISGEVRAISYLNGEVFVICAGAIYVFSDDMSTLLRSSTGLGAGFGLVANSKRISTGSGSIILARTGGGVVENIYQVKLSDLEIITDLNVAGTDLVRKSEPFSWLLFNPQHGTAFVAGHNQYTVLWPIIATGDDMNPAHIIRECLTDRLWGMGYNESDVDDASFTAAADTFYAESFGLSMLWQTEEEIGQFINTVLSHVDAFLYTSRSTGKFVLKPIRADYDIDTIPVIDEDDVVEWNEVSRRQPAEVVTSVIVKHYDRSKEKDASRAVHNIAQIQQSDGIISTTRFYPGITNSNLAVRVGTRDVKSLGAGMASGRITCKRTVESLNPGDPFRMVSARHDFDGEVMRVGELTFGDGRQNAIGLKFAQDVFHLGTDVLVDGGESPWVNPSIPAVAMTRRLVHEMPYREMVQMIGSDAAVLLGTDAGAGLVQVAGGKPSDNTIYALISIDPGTGYEDAADTLDFFAPHAVLDAALGLGDTAVDVTDDVDLEEVVIGSLAVINGEIVRIDTIAGQTLTIGRGCLDTVPAEHAEGDAIIFFDDFSMSDFAARTDAAEIDVKLRPVTGRGALELVDAPADALIFASRAIRPYPPKGVEVDGNPGFAGAVDVTGSDPFTVTWTRRNRLTETIAAPLDWTDADETPEGGQTTTVTLTDPDGVVLHSYTAISGTSQAVDHADFGGAPLGYVVVSSIRDGHESWQAFRVPVIVSTAAGEPMGLLLALTKAI